MPNASAIVQDVVSVIVPTYNRSALLLEAVDSVYAQTYRPIELIIVDDGSTDDTCRAIDEWGSRHSDPSFTVCYLTQDNQRVCRARNHGLSEATGEFIQYLDSDDLLLPDKLKKQVSFLHAHPTYDYVYSMSLIARDIMPDGYSRSRCTGAPIPEGREDDYIGTYNWTVMGPLYRRGVCDAVGAWDGELMSSQDLLYETKVKCLRFRGAFMDEALDIWRQHDGERMTGNGLMVSAESGEMVARKIGFLLKEYNIDSHVSWNVLARYCIRAGLAYGLLGDYESRARCLSEARIMARGAYRIVVEAACLLTHVLPVGLLFRLGQKISHILRSMCA